MASASAGIALAVIPGVGWVASAGILMAAALIDSYVVMPALAGKGRSAAKPPRLLDSPVGSNEPGAPRIFGIGKRVRIPTHVLWQDDKVRETGGSSTKGGMTAVQQRVLIDALVALNDRLTVRMKQMHGNGKMIIGELNLGDITTNGMTVSVSGVLLVLTMVDTAEPDFIDKLAVNDVVTLAGFIPTAGADPNVGFWRVAAVIAHTSTGSQIQLAAYSGQVVPGIVATAGTAESPASVTRIDDHVFSDGSGTIWTTASQIQLGLTKAAGPPPDVVFRPGDMVIVLGLTLPTFGSLDAVQWIVEQTTSSTMSFRAVVPPGISDPGPISGGSGTNAIRVQYLNPPVFSNGVFPPGFVPTDHFHNGSETQGEDAILAADKGTGNIPGYRGTAYQALVDLAASLFGDQLPYSLEAVIEVDPGMTWAQAFRVILERAGIPAEAIDTWGIDDRPFEGFFLRGAVPTLTSMQPMLIAGNVLGQERDGVIVLFNLQNADQVQVANSAEFSDLGVVIGGESHDDTEIVVQDTADEDLPTHVGVRHQDPDNGYADGYQSFGLRNPAGVDWQNATELDLSNLVLTRKRARDLAATSLRRAHINRRTFRMVLGMRYLDLAENDLIRVTDRFGNDILCRIIQRDIGADLRVAILCVAEHLDIVVTGSPVQSAAGVPPRRLDRPAHLEVAVLDIPALRDEEWTAPGIKVAACASGGGWSGASIWVSFDGTSYTNHGVIGVQAGIGTLATVLAAGTQAESFGTTTVTVDPAHTVDVAFANEGPQGLGDASLVDALAGANWCAIVDATGTVEVAAFLTATFVSGSTWTLSNLLRGLRGTTPIEHLAGARIVLLSPFHSSGVTHVRLGLLTPHSFSIKVVPSGLSIDEVEPIPVTTTWRNARPLPVRSVSKTIDAGTGDARIRVEAAWSRLVRAIGAQVAMPVDDLPEAYRFTIFAPDGTTIVQQVDVFPQPGSPTILDKWIDYTAADQAADGYAPGDLIWIDVQQIGAAGLGPSIKQEL